MLPGCQSSNSAAVGRLEAKPSALQTSTAARFQQLTSASSASSASYFGDLWRNSLCGTLFQQHWHFLRNPMKQNVWNKVLGFRLRSALVKFKTSAAPATNQGWCLGLRKASETVVFQHNVKDTVCNYTLLRNCLTLVG